MTYSNLPKIKPKLRTSGRVSGNFGRNKVSAGSSLNDIGVTNVKLVKCTTQTEYLNRLYTALDNTTDPELLKFLYHQIRSIHIQRGTW
jgi:hypothetical protein